MNKKLSKIIEKVDMHDGYLTTSDLVKYGMYKNAAQASYLRNQDRFPDYVNKVGNVFCYEKKEVINYINEYQDYLLECVLAPHVADGKRKMNKDEGIDLTKVAAFENSISEFKAIFDEEIEDLRNKVVSLLGVKKGE
jgi:hypothetical protein